MFFIKIKLILIKYFNIFAFADRNVSRRELINFTVFARSFKLIIKLLDDYEIIREGDIRVNGLYLQKIYSLYKFCLKDIIISIEK